MLFRGTRIDSFVSGGRGEQAQGPVGRAGCVDPRGRKGSGYMPGLLRSMVISPWAALGLVGMGRRAHVVAQRGEGECGMQHPESSNTVTVQGILGRVCMCHQALALGSNPGSVLV